MRAIVYAKSGSTPTVEICQRPTPVPMGRQVLVQTRYVGINPADVMQLNGGYPSPAGAPADVAGVEVAGRVVRCADAVTDLSVGDRVFGLVAGGGLADRVIADADLVTTIPHSLDDVTAAAVPESFITAHDALFTQGGLRSGERVLIHGGTGGVGSATISLARLAGADVYATARQPTGRELVRSLGASALDPADFAAEFRQRSAALGADVIIDLVGAPNFPANLELLAPGGRIVAVGLGGGSQVSFSLNDLMRARGRLVGTVLRARPYVEKAQAVAAFAREVVPHLAAGRLAPLIDEVFPVQKYEAAFARMASAGKRGKLLVDFAAESTTNEEEAMTCRT